MKIISVSVSEEDYEVFRSAAKAEHRPIAQLIREAMALYREQKLSTRTRLEQLPVLVGHHVARPLPTREEIYDEAFGDGDTT